MASKTLIVYYSMDGNTRQIAQRLQKSLDADIQEIQPVHPYTGTDEEIVKQGEDEVRRGFLPELKPLPYQVADYDIILIGTPTWWYTMASPVRSFIAANDWTGKTVIPFQTHCGWPGKGLQDIAAACKGARAVHEKAIQFNPRQFGLLVTHDDEVLHWIESLK